MRSHSQIVKDAGAVEAIADRHGVSVHTVRSWIQRNSIPAEHWARLAGDDCEALIELALSAERKVPA